MTRRRTRAQIERDLWSYNVTRRNSWQNQPVDFHLWLVRLIILGTLAAILFLAAMGDGSKF